MKNVEGAAQIVLQADALIVAAGAGTCEAYAGGDTGLN